MDHAERWLTCEEISARWGMTSTKTVYRLIRSGELSGIKLGRRWRFRPEDVAAYEDSLKASA